MKTVDLRGYEEFYTISENGDVISKRRGRLMKPSDSGLYGYLSVNLSNGYGSKHYYVHRLVLEHFVGACPEGKESHHIDHNSGNNHVSNLEWVTHQENILRSFTEGGREGFWKGRERGAFSKEHRDKMALAKEQPILWGAERFRSINACAGFLGISRIMIFLYRRNHRPYKGNYFIKDIN